jgi:hypothetical protein
VDLNTKLAIVALYGAIPLKRRRALLASPEITHAARSIENVSQTIDGSARSAALYVHRFGQGKAGTRPEVP